MNKDQLNIFLQKLIPQHALSRFLGWIANCHWTWMKNHLIKWFIQRYQVDLSEAIEINPYQYRTFNDFFTRHLNPAFRPIATDPKVIVSPVDGIISQAGSVHKQQLIQAKGFDYDLNSLLGGDPMLVSPFYNGSFITLYLAPKNYHRVHMPITGQLKKMIYVPGNLFSVNFMTANNIPNLFSQNERVICFFETAIGEMAIVLVGALIVASIHTVWAGKITPAKQQSIQIWSYPEPVILSRGQELGHFELGSTVIVLFEPGRLTELNQLMPQQSVQFGQKLAKLVNQEKSAIFKEKIIGDS